MLLTTRTAVAPYDEGRGDRRWGTGVGGSWISPLCVGAIAVLSCSQEGEVSGDVPGSSLSAVTRGTMIVPGQ